MHYKNHFTHNQGLFGERGSMKTSKWAWAKEHEHEQVNMSKGARPSLFLNILPMWTWYFKNILSHDIIYGDVEEYSSMCHRLMIFMDENGDENDNGWTFSWTFATSFILQKNEPKK